MGSPIAPKPNAADAAAANAAKWQQQKAAAKAEGITLADPPPLIGPSDDKPAT